MEMNQRSRFTRMAACLLVCLALAFLLAERLPQKQVQVMPVPLEPEMEELLGEERSAAFACFFEQLQIWYGSHSVGPDGVRLTQSEDYEELQGILYEAGVYLDSDGPSRTALSGEVEQKYRTAESNLFMFLFSTMMPVLSTLGQEEAVEISPEGWEGLGDGIDELIRLYTA